MANSNSSLRRAQRVKNDEFYTRYEDIEAELQHYLPQFKNKVVYINCDNPAFSNFWRFFVNNFKKYKLKKLLCSWYEKDNDKCLYTIYTGKSDFCEMPFCYNDGDFRKQDALLQQCDIVVGNPPFSLFREFIQKMVDYNKKFLVIGNANSVATKEVFPLIKNDKLQFGYNKVVCFITPSNKNKNVFAKWFTNLCVEKCNKFLPLTKHYTPQEFQKYDNYNAINVNKVADIPCDYDGVMGVPISFFDKCDYKQFELISIGWGVTAHNVGVKKNYRGRTDLAITINGKSTCPYNRILIRRKLYKNTRKDGVQ